MARTDPKQPVVLPLHLRSTARSLSLSLHRQTKTFRNTLIPFRRANLGGLLCARAQTNVHVHFRERERLTRRDLKNKKKVQTRERLRKRALPRCRDLTLRETKSFCYTVICV
jgi:hypothetical protein